MTLIRISVVAIIVILGYFSYSWIKSQAGSRFLASGSNSSELEPDYYMHGFVIHGADINGQPKFKLRAEYLEHLPYDDHSDLLGPKLHFYVQDGGPPWCVRARTGYIESQGKVIRLNGLVNITRAGSEFNRPTSIITSNIIYQPGIDFLKSDDNATYTIGLNQLHGKGVTVNLKDNIVNLSNPDGRYEPDVEKVERIEKRQKKKKSAK